MRLVREHRGEYPSEWAAICSIAEKFGVAGEMVRNRVRQAQVDDCQRPATTTEESAELKRLRRENAELKRSNEILKSAANVFAAELDRPHIR